VSDAHGTPHSAALPEMAALLREIEQVLAANEGHHPGVIAEAVVERLLEAYTLTPREPWHRERRRNHEERVRRYAHQVFRLLEDAPSGGPAEREIAALVAKAFILQARAPAAGTGGRP